MLTPPYPPLEKVEPNADTFLSTLSTFGKSGAKAKSTLSTLSTFGKSGANN
jgi:hypothetical protein